MKRLVSCENKLCCLICYQRYNSFNSSISLQTKYILFTLQMVFRCQPYSKRTNQQQQHLMQPQLDL